MRALVLEEKGKISIRDIEVDEKLGLDDVEIEVKNVGICGSDVHYYTHGGIGPYIVNEPMILGHEASGLITRVGKNVKNFKIGDRVCMEPGIPNLNSRATREGFYNLDPEVRFWATPPIHGVARERVVHPASFTFKLPDNVSLAEGAMVEPLAIGFQSIKKAAIFSGDFVVVIGAGTIGLMVVLAALTQGCRNIMVVDVAKDKLEIAKKIDNRVITFTYDNNSKELIKKVNELTLGKGAEVLFEASGSQKVGEYIMDVMAPAGTIVYVGMPLSPVPLDIVKAQAKEITIKTIFRYANMYERAIDSIASGLINVKDLITKTFPFERSVEAYEYAVKTKEPVIKIQIEL